MHHHLITIAAAAAKEPLPPVAAELLGAAAIGFCLVIAWFILKSILG